MLNLFKTQITFISFFFIIIFNSHSLAKVIDLNGSPGKISIIPFIDYLEDKGKKMTISDINPHDKQINWKPFSTRPSGLDYTESSYWIRMEVRNIINRDIDFFLEQDYPLIDYLTLYIPDNTGSYTEVNTGDMRPFSSRPYNNRHFVFPLKIKAGAVSIFYLRFQTTSMMDINLSIWAPASFKENSSADYMLLLFYYGIVLVMVLYNLFVYFFIRRVEHLYYAILSFFYLIFWMSINGTAFEFLWPNFPYWNNICVPLFLSLFIVSILLFGARLADLKKYSETNTIIRSLHRAVILLTKIYILVFIQSIILPYKISIIITTSYGVISILVALITGIAVTIIKRDRSALLGILSSSAILLGVLIYTLKNKSVLPSNLFTEWSIQNGSVIMLILFSIALADRINVIRKELQLLTNNLEDKVNDRTSELQKALEELSLKDADIKRDLKLAGKVQQSIFPKISDQWKGINLSIFYDLKETVGGDYYDFLNINNEKLGIVISDVSGHGVPAALITMIAKVSFQTAAKNGISPVEMLRFVNREIIDTVKDSNLYMTCFLLIIDIEHNIVFSNASHQKALHYKKAKNVLDELDTNGILLGASKEADETYEEKILKLDPGDRIVLFTGGAINIKNNSNEEYGLERLKQLIKEGLELKTGELMNKIELDIIRHRGDAAKNDDITIIIIESDPIYHKFLNVLHEGDRLNDEGKKDEALIEYRKCLDLQPGSSDILLKSGRLACELEDRDRAKEYYTNYILNNKHNADAFYSMSVILYHEGKYQDSIKNLDIALDLRTNFEKAKILKKKCEEKMNSKFKKS